MSTRVAAAKSPKPAKIDLPFADDAEIAVMVELFEQCRWPYERWTHRAHLALAVHYLSRHPYEDALALVRANIQMYNRTCGDADGYHETITVLFLRRVARALAERHDGDTFVAVVDRLCRCCDMRWLLRYYSPGRLRSAAAKASWLEPDLRPLDF